MSYPPVSIQHALCPLCPSKGGQGSSPCRLSSRSSGSESSMLHEDIPDEIFESNMISEDEVWQIFFYGTSRTCPNGKIITGVGVIFISPQNHVLPRAFSLTEPCSNNVTEYNALLICLQLTHEMGYAILKLTVIQS